MNRKKLRLVNLILSRYHFGSFNERPFTLCEVVEEISRKFEETIVSSPLGGGAGDQRDPQTRGSHSSFGGGSFGGGSFQGSSFGGSTSFDDDILFESSVRRAQLLKEQLASTIEKLKSAFEEKGVKFCLRGGKMDLIWKHELAQQGVEMSNKSKFPGIDFTPNSTAPPPAARRHKGDAHYNTTFSLTCVDFSVFPSFEDFKDFRG